MCSLGSTLLLETPRFQRSGLSPDKNRPQAAAYDHIRVCDSIAAGVCVDVALFLLSIHWLSWSMGMGVTEAGNSIQEGCGNYRRQFAKRQTLVNQLKVIPEYKGCYSRIWNWGDCGQTLICNKWHTACITTQCLVCGRRFL